MGDGRGEEQALLRRDVGDQPLAECGFLDLTWGMAHIDDQPIDREHPDEDPVLRKLCMDYPDH
jgi:hypothetical protein